MRTNTFVRSLVRDKFLVLAGLFLLTWWQSPQNFVTLYIVFGQGHFLITYLYQYRAGKINAKYLLMYIPILLLCFFALIKLPFEWLVFITGTIFAVHAVFDEARLTYRDAVPNLLAISVPIILFSATLFESLFEFDAITPALFLVGTVLVGTAVSQRGEAIYKAFASLPSVYVNVISLLLIIVYASRIEVSAEVLLGSIVLYHYGSWYVHYYFRTANDPIWNGRYLADIFLINAVVLLGFLTFILFEPANPLKFFFIPTYFYSWTILHILFTSHDFMKLVASQVKSVR